MSPAFSTLPWMTAGRPLSLASTMVEAYSVLRLSTMGVLPATWARTVSSTSRRHAGQLRRKSRWPPVSLPRVALHQVGALAKVGHVFGKVAAGLGDKGAKMEHHLKAHRVAVIDLGHPRRLAQPG